MAFTVTATQSGSSSNRGVYLKVLVLTNATEAGGATSGANNASGVVASGSLTPNFSNSFVGFSVAEDGVAGGLNAAASNNTYDYSNADATDSWSSAQGHYTGTVTASSALTYGESTFASGDHSNWCAYEVPASGGAWAIDGSSPAGVNTTSGTAVTTATFGPPAGSVLVALVTAGGSASGTGITVTMTDTSGTGMTWTRRAISSTSDSFQPCYVFTATVPVVIVSSYAGNASPGRTWQRRFHHIQRPPFPSYVPPPPLVYGNQPHGYGSSRRSITAVFGGLAAPPLPGPAGTAPRPMTVRRRSAARAVWLGYVSRTVNAGGVQAVSGTAPAHLVVARRTAARAVWYGHPVPGQQPRAASGVLIRRRTAARAVWYPTSTRTTNLLYGNQPGGLVRRRSAARAVWRGSAIPAQQPRAASGALVRRRTAARAVWAGVTVRTTNLLYGNQPGGLVRRRSAARAVWAGVIARTVNGSATPPVSGTAPVHLVVARRQAARAVWYPTSTRTTNLLYGNQPHGEIHRRAPARAVWRGSAVAGQPPRPGTGGLVRRRTAARAVQAGTVTRTVNAAPSAPVNGTVPDHLVVARRMAARVVWRGTVVRTVNAATPNGTAQPRATVPVPRRAAARAVWDGNAVAPRRPAPATGGLVRRRPPARGRWTGTVSRTANAPPPPFTVGTLTAQDAALAVLTGTTAAGGSGGVLTATDQRTGGPGG